MAEKRVSTGAAGGGRSVPRNLAGWWGRRPVLGRGPGSEGSEVRGHWRLLWILSSWRIGPSFPFLHSHFVKPHVSSSDGEWPEVIGHPLPIPQAKLLEEMDQEFGVSTLVEEEFGQRRQVRLRRRLGAGDGSAAVLGAGIPGLSGSGLLTWLDGPPPL